MPLRLDGGLDSRRRPLESPVRCRRSAADLRRGLVSLLRSAEGCSCRSWRRSFHHGRETIPKRLPGAGQHAFDGLWGRLEASRHLTHRHASKVLQVEDLAVLDREMVEGDPHKPREFAPFEGFVRGGVERSQGFEERPGLRVGLRSVGGWAPIVRAVASGRRSRIGRSCRSR